MAATKSPSKTLFAWTKGSGDASQGWSGRIEPFTAKVTPKGDGRWNWEVTKDQIRHAVATGVASSLGAAKTAAEQFAKRSGLF